MSTQSLYPKLDVRASLAEASSIPLWFDDPRRPEPRPSLSGAHSADLVIVGGGFTGLWAALLAKEQQPDRRVILIEANTVGWAASGRNGGFCSASLTHGYDNGKKHLPNEVDVLEQLGMENLAEIEATIARYQMDCGFERSGEIMVALHPHQERELASAHDPDNGQYWLDQTALKEHIDSPLFLGGLWDTQRNALVNPAQLCWELARVITDLGVDIFENSLVTQVSSTPWGIKVETRTGEVRAAKVILGTNVFPSLIPALRFHTVPVYDYVLATEPLTQEQLEAIGWSRRQGISDVGNQFHYFRLTPNNRILWGGWDAVYHFGRRIKPAFDQRSATFTTLATHFHHTFPQLSGVKFSHAWGGAIDTCTRFFPFFHSSHGGAVVSALGFTGLGVGASRFAARVMLDLLSDNPSPLCELEMVRQKPLPFPPEPLAWLGIQLTTRALIRSDQQHGRRGPWLKMLDAFGVGFDS
ncbi:FAD-dependent oxidoreductase [Corynebacterium poyangense]|uniref:FAD-dependent oxidoreductase n=1 Tax=Corynebacterium poyangense TaxID=2684405 RepID=A0A7H0SL74_9CORY|nr:FAD-binding oxidoreductase [Corynebacterium poyangense]QNQ89299.1 FAD-dependent oxidoreductase [Corynebacterium poyangense]